MFSALARFIPLLCIFMYDVIFVVALDKMQYYLGVWKSVISFYSGIHDCSVGNKGCPWAGGGSFFILDFGVLSGLVEMKDIEVLCG